MSADTKHRWWVVAALLIGLMAMPPLAQANEQLEQMSQNPNQWVMPGRTYDINRHSPLKQINAENVKELQVAWTMSSGALRGHEGQPLVVGNMMYFQSAYPNYVYAVDLNDIGRIAWKFTPPAKRFGVGRPRSESRAPSVPPRMGSG